MQHLEKRLQKGGCTPAQIRYLLMRIWNLEIAAKTPEYYEEDTTYTEREKVKWAVGFQLSAQMGGSLGHGGPWPGA